MRKTVKFVSCANGGEYTGFGSVTPSTMDSAFVTNASTTIPTFYASDPVLGGKVEGIGKGWQKFELPGAGQVKFVVRGGAGGATGQSGYSINASSGAVSGSGNRPGRGAKLEGYGNFNKGDILYMLVGFRGWCNNGADWGGGGGGASVVLLDDPSGPYTFAPLNRKVTPLFVAGGGGGCYDSSFGSSYYGTDANTGQTITVKGGSAAQSPGAGAGLNGASTGNYITPSILSGNTYDSTAKQPRCGGWGGGGHPYDGGGSGGGMQGGNQTTNSGGGQGGYSYIHPSKITATYRGYATTSADSARNLTNPWSAYGHIELEIEVGRDPNKMILAKDSDGYKWFDGRSFTDKTETNFAATEQWQLLPNQSDPDEDTFKLYGDTNITNAVGLKDQVRFMLMSKKQDEDIKITGMLNKMILKQKTDAQLSDISLIKSFNYTANLSGMDVKFAVSKNAGGTWQTYNIGTWIDVDINDRDEFYTYGYPLNQITAIPLTDWNTYKPKQLRFAFCITQTSPTTNTILQVINLVADLNGSWRHFKDTEAEYSYISDSELEVKFLAAGNYKVNYMDSLTSGSST